MDYHYSKKSKIVFGISILGLLAPIGSSLFVISDRDSNDSYNTTTEANAVAYIEGLDGIYFPTVSDAIIYANNNTEDTIYVIPGDIDGDYTQSYIDTNCTLESTDTLIIPYNGETYEPGDYNEENDYFADYNQSENTLDEYLRTEVIISEGKTFTNEGIIYIGGILGKSESRSNQRPTGHVAGNYAQISMEYDSKIINKGTIYSYGFIKERLKDNSSTTTSPEIINKDGSYFYTPITIYDYFGGTYTSGASNNSAMPFHIFDFNNIQTIITFDAGSKMYCYYCLYISTSSYNLTGDLYIIGNEGEACLFGLSSGSVSFHYKGKTSKRTSDDEYTYSYSYLDFNTAPSASAPSESDLARTYVYINEDSDLDIQHFTINISSSGAMDTAEYFVPFSYKFIIEVLDKGTININNDTQFLGGSQLIIDEGGTANFNATTLFYEESVLYNENLEKYYPDLGEAVCLINGTAYLNTNFGGIVTTNTSNAYLYTSETFFNRSSTVQQVSADRSGLTITSICETVSYDARAKITYSESEDAGTLQYIEGNTTYVSRNNDYFYGVKGEPTYITVRDSDRNYELTISNDESNGFSLNLYAYLNTDTINSLENVEWTTDNQTYASISQDGLLTIISTPSSEETITVTATYENNDSILTGMYVLTIEEPDDDAGCFEKGTLVYTRRGNILIEEITLEDEVLSFNHFTGKFEYKPISLIVNHGIGIYKIMNMQFSDGSEINLIGNHGLFDKTLNKYVDICADNCYSFINHDFVRYIDGNIKLVKLVNVNIERRMTESYTCFSYGNLNTIANSFLNITSIVYGFYNLFNYLENMQYDAKEIEEDIAKYGLTSYKELKDYVSKDIFEAFNGKYINIAIGKGLLTQDSLMDLINNWLNKLVKNNEAFTNYDIH